MAKELVQFAGGGAVVADNRIDPELSNEITQYIEEESDFRQFIKVVKVNTYSVVLPRKWAAGIAVEIVEGSEIPKARDVYDQLSFNLRQIGTGIKMTDEEQQMMAFDPNYFQTEARRANERLLKKENNDIREVMLSGAGYNVVTPQSGLLTFDDIVDVKTAMSEHPYGMDPDMILMSERTYATLLKDPDFKTYSSSGIAGVVQDGEFGLKVAGLSIKIIRELDDVVFIIDSSKDPIILVTMNGVHTEKYRLPETREDVLDLTYWEKPAVIRPDAIAKIVLGSTASQRKDYKFGIPDPSNPVDNDAIMQSTIVSGGWDPVDGYNPDDSYAPYDPAESPRLGDDKLPVAEDNPESNQNNQNSNQQDQTPTTYSVTFRVTNAGNQGLSNVDITLTDVSDSTNTKTESTTSGDVTISVKPGTYKVTASRAGYIAPENIPDVTVTNANVTVSDAIIMTSE